MNAQKSIARIGRKRYQARYALALTPVKAPIPEIAITKYDGAWCYQLGSHYTSTGFHDYEDPAVVAKFINSMTAGPINVIVNL